jgi:hypothetical protein
MSEDAPAAYVRQLFRESIGVAIQKDASGRPRFDSTAFFDDWFHEKGNVYFFLFRKNLRVTNLQLAELFALLRTETYYRNSLQARRKPNIQFNSARDFKTALEKAVEEFQALEEPDQTALLGSYGNLLENQIVADAYYGSCSVYLPPHLDLDLPRICASSGYIHSCGRLVFIRNTNKATTEQFFERLDTYFLKFPITPPVPALFVVYAHEDFSADDRDYADDLKHGLDDVKIHINKAHFQRESLISLIDKMKEKYKGTILIADPLHYKKQRKKVTEEAHVQFPRTFWLISDSGAKFASKFPSEDRYYICYDQTYKNVSPLLIFDEEKPAWINQTTIPHTLSAAMINITRPWWATSSGVTIHDPFGGTGTIFLDALKFKAAEPSSSDKSPITPLLVKDNVEFFRKNSREIEEIKKELEEMLGNFSESSPSFAKRVPSKAALMYDNVVHLIELSLKNSGSGHEIEIPSAHFLEFRQLQLYERIAFYVAARTAIRHYAEFRRNASEWSDAFREELRKLLRRIELFRAFERKREDNSECIADNIFSIPCSYSKGCFIDSIRSLSNDLFGGEYLNVSVRDALELTADSLDIIVTDPPYGFNTEQDASDLAELYSAMVRVFVSALRDGGQLVICCPERSYSGRPLPFYTEPGFIIQQVLAAASTTQKLVYQPAFGLPSESRTVRPPYYWESERALRRSVLHFWVRHS